MDKKTINVRCFKLEQISLFKLLLALSQFVVHLNLDSFSILKSIDILCLNFLTALILLSSPVLTTSPSSGISWHKRPIDSYFIIMSIHNGICKLRILPQYLTFLMPQIRIIMCKQGLDCDQLFSSSFYSEFKEPNQRANRQYYDDKEIRDKHDKDQQDHQQRDVYFRMRIKVEFRKANQEGHHSSVKCFIKYL